MQSRVRRVLYASCCVGAVICLLVVLAFLRAGRAVEDAETSADAAASLAFSRSRLSDTNPSGIEYLSTPAAFRDGAEYGGRLYLGGAQGVIAVDELGHVTESWRTGERLPAPVVALAASASDLWIATNGAGLLRYDGRAFEQILPADAALRRTTAVLPLSTGAVLIGTPASGVLAYDGKRLRPFHPQLAKGRVNGLAGSDTDLWVATSDRGLLHLRAGQLDAFTEQEGLPDSDILSIAATADRAWAGTALGIAEFSDGRFTRTLGEGLFARAVARDGDELLVGTLENGLYRVSLASRRPSSYPATTTGGVEKIIHWSGRDWALRNDNLYDARSAEPLLAPPQTILSDRNISALSVDNRGRLWVGYFDRGIDVIESDFVSVRHREDQHLFCVNRILQDPARSLTAVATANGLVLLDFNVETRQVLGRAEGLISNHVTDLVLTRGGMIAATSAGLTWLDAGGPRSLYAFHGLINNHVYSVAAMDDRLAAGTLGGLSVLESGFVKANYSTANSPLKQNWIAAVAALGRDFYIGTYGAGVARLDAGGRWQTFPDLPPIVINPNALTASGERVYAGSLGHGLWKYSVAANRWTNLVRGLPSSNVTAVAAAGGYLFIGTDNGIARIPENAL